LQREGIGVLWATHLIEEAQPGDDVAVLHRGRIRAAGRLDTIVEQSGGETMAGAFAKLVQEDAQDSADEDS
jgi:ABC-2 type transport system ATP-binding protein